MPEDPALLPLDHQHEDAVAERVSLELRGQVARAQRMVERTRELLAHAAVQREQDEDSTR